MKCKDTSCGHLLMLQKHMLVEPYEVSRCYNLDAFVIVGETFTI